jgi:hypothetical protein
VLFAVRTAARNPDLDGELGFAVATWVTLITKIIDVTNVRITRLRIPKT